MDLVRARPLFRCGKLKDECTRDRFGRTLVPTLRYRDVPAAIAWLCNAFGFQKHLVVSGEDDFIRYAQLTYGDGMVMVVPSRIPPSTS